MAPLVTRGAGDSRGSGVGSSLLLLSGRAIDADLITISAGSIAAICLAALVVFETGLLIYYVRRGSAVRGRR